MLGLSYLLSTNKVIKFKCKLYKQFEQFGT